MTATPDTGRNPALEAWLDDHHVQWRYVEALELDLIDKQRSLTNQARLEPLDPEVVDRYQADYKRGHHFPALLARKTSRQAKKLVLLGGNHRYHAATGAGLTVHPVYVVECEPETALVLTYQDNRIHGLPPSRVERCAQAVHLVRTGWAGKDAAAELGVGAAEVSNAVTVADASLRAKELGVSQFDKLAGVTRLACARATSEPVFVGVVKLAASAGMAAPAVADLVKRCAKAGSDVKALEVIDEVGDDLRHQIQSTAGGKTTGPKGRAGGGPTAYSTAKTAAVKILDLRPLEVAASCPTADAGARLREQLKRAARMLMEIDKAMGGR